jgi:hypothetical protein
VNQYYLILNDFITIVEDGEDLIERLQWVGTGRAQRLVNLGDELKLTLQFDVHWQTTGASANIAFSAAKNLRDPNIAGFDNPIPVASPDYDTLESRATGGESAASVSASREITFKLNTNDFIQFFVRSDKTDPIEIYNYAINAKNV